MKKIGFIDYYLDEWHANNYPQWITETSRNNFDCKLEYCWAECDKIDENSLSTDDWCKKFGVKKCTSIDDLCEKSDYIIILAPSNPEKHLEYAQKVLSYGKRTYIDKTFAPNYKISKKIFSIAKKYRTDFFSSSALRYALELNNFKNTKDVLVIGGGRIMEEYIIHQIEMIVTLLKEKPKKLKVEKRTEGQYLISINFENQKKGTIVFASAFPFGIEANFVDGTSNFTFINSDYFKILISDILNFFSTGVKSFNSVETLYVMKIREKIIQGISECDKWLKL